MSYEVFACKRCGALTGGPQFDYCLKCQKELAQHPRQEQRAEDTPAPKPPKQQPRSGTRGGGGAGSQAKKSTESRVVASGTKRDGLRTHVNFRYYQKAGGDANMHDLLGYLQYREGRGAEPHVRIDCDPKDRWIDGGLGQGRAEIATRLRELAEGNPRAYAHTLVVSPDPAQFNELREDTPDFQARFVGSLNNAMERWADERDMDLEWAAVVHHPIKEYGLQTHAHIVLGAGCENGIGGLRPVYNYAEDLKRFKEIWAEELGKSLDPEHEVELPRGITEQMRRALETPLEVPDLPPMERETDEDTISLKDAAEWLGMKPRTLRRWVSTERIAGQKDASGRWRVSVDSLEEYARRELGGDDDAVVFKTGVDKEAEQIRFAAVSVKEVAQAMRRPARTVRGMLQRGELEGYLDGKRWRVYRDSVEKYAERHGWERSPFQVQDERERGELVTTKDVATALRIPTRTVRGMISKKTIHGVRAGRSWLVERAGVERYAQEKLGWGHSPFEPQKEKEQERQLSSPPPSRERDRDIPERRVVRIRGVN